MFERILNFWVRHEACRLAARVCQGHEFDGEIGSHLWSVTVFFEAYIHGGCEATVDDFGPKDAVELKIVRESRGG